MIEKRAEIAWLEPSNWRLSISVFLGIGLGALTFVAVGGALAIGLYASFTNTRELLLDKSRMLLGSLETALADHLETAVQQAGFLASLIEDGALQPQDRARVQEVAYLLVGSTPRIQALVLLTPDGWEVGAARTADGLGPYQSSWPRDRSASAALLQARQQGTSEPSWGRPVFTEGLGPIVNLRRPIYGPDGFLGVVVAAVQTTYLARFIADLQTEVGQTAFVLYGTERVLAHPALNEPLSGLSREKPLPGIDEIGDPVLASMWRPGWREDRLIAGQGHTIEVDGVTYIFLYDQLSSFGEEPLVVGSYFPEADIATQFERFFRALVVGLLGLVVAVASAFLIGRMLRRPIVQLADAAARVQAFDLEAVPKMGRSRFLELDSAGRAFDAMVVGLRAFRLYMPRDLVPRLMQRGTVEDLPSETRDVAIMFTDIGGFTSRTERFGAEATAAFLNRHFDLVTRCVEAEGGIVDKFIGDGVMALWGALGDQDDPMERSARAAIAIADAIRAATDLGEIPIKLRIGLHAGPVVVGNIGSHSRMNYTVIGDPVNTAARLESLGKDLCPGAPVVILISDVIRSALGTDFEVESVGVHHLRGRDAPTEVFRLIA